MADSGGAAHSSWASHSRIATPCSSRSGGGRWRGAAARVVVVVEAQRRARQPDPSVRRVVDLEQQPLGPGLLPVVDVVDGAHLPGRDARGDEQVEPVLGGCGGEDALDLGDQAPAGSDSLAVGAVALVVRVEPDRPGEGVPQPLRRHAHLDRGRRGREQAVRRDRRVVRAGEARHLARDGPAGALEGVQPDHARQQRGADHPASPGAVPLVQRRDHAVREVQAGDQVGDGNADLGGHLGAGDAHQTALALGDLVVAGAVALRPVVPEAGDPADDQGRVERVEALLGEAEAVQHPDPEVLQHHVGARQEPGQRADVARRLEVQDDGLLVAVGRHEVRRVPWVVRTVARARPRWSPGPGVVAVGALDLDHPRAQVAQHHRRLRPGQGTGQVDHQHVGQGARIIHDLRR